MVLNEIHDQCQFFKEHTATIRYFLSKNKVDDKEFDFLLESGFRKFGSMFFKYSCESCSACIPLRVSVDDFKSSKSQKRVLKKNSTLVFTTSPVSFKREHFDLYRKHNLLRFGKDDDDLYGYIGSFCQSPVDSLITEIYCADRLIGAGFVDLGRESLSSVYFFYDPEYNKRSPGIFSVIKEIELAKHLEKKYYYLGFCVKGEKFSDYKAGFRPNQTYDPHTGKWV
jgi:leucyl-tRNA---protein transferase